MIAMKRLHHGWGVEVGFQNPGLRIDLFFCHGMIIIDGSDMLALADEIVAEILSLTLGHI